LSWPTPIVFVVAPGAAVGDAFTSTYTTHCPGTLELGAPGIWMLPTVKLLLPTVPAVIDAGHAVGSPASAGPSVVLASESALGMLSTSVPPVSVDDEMLLVSKNRM
jgi:hypothetical protein